MKNWALHFSFTLLLCFSLPSHAVDPSADCDGLNRKLAVGKMVTELANEVEADKFLREKYLAKGGLLRSRAFVHGLNNLEGAQLNSTNDGKFISVEKFDEVSKREPKNAAKKIWKAMKSRYDLSFLESGFTAKEKAKELKDRFTDTGET